MAVRRLHHHQPVSFAFTPENGVWAAREVAKYPPGRERSAVISLLWRAQEQHHNWLPEPAIRYVADMLAMPYIQALEIATFYTMFQLAPVGSRAHLLVCGTTPCMLRGSDGLIEVCRDRIAHDAHEVSADGAFSWEEVECIGACVNAPLVQIGKATYEDLTPALLETLLDDLAAGRPVAAGSQADRAYSAPEGGLTTLTDLAIFLDEDVPISAATAGGGDAAEGRPTLLSSPRGTADDLERIVGIGPKLAKTLNAMGVYHFDQIAAWTAENLRWVDAHLGAFQGRAERDRWIEQAARLVVDATASRKTRERTE